METTFTDLVGCRVPIQQAPMGSVSTPDLAVAVAEAGGVGSITALGLRPGRLDEMLASMTARTSGALAVNFLTDRIDTEAVAVAAAYVRVVDFFWTNPDAALVEIAHRAGALACWQVGSADEARAAADAGCDIVVVQGTEAGGHVHGHSPLAALLAETVGAVDVPVLAAGGIVDATTLRAALDAGAAGARVGTRFIATTESGAHPLYKQALVAAAADSTEITGAFAVCPLCATSPRHRALRRCIDAVEGRDDTVLGTAVVGGSTIDIPPRFGMPPDASTTGAIEAMAMYAGAGVGAITSVDSVAAVVASMCGA